MADQNTCEMCGGEGLVTIHGQPVDLQTDCPACHGTGKVEQKAAYRIEQEPLDAITDWTKVKSGTGVASEPDIEPNIDSQTPDKESLDLAAKFNMPHHALRILTQAGPVTNLPTEPLGEFRTADDKPPAPILDNQTQEQPGSDELEAILVNFMEQIEEVGQSIEGRPTTTDILRVDAVYDSAKAAIEQLIRKQMEHNLVINLSDVAFAQGQLEGLTGKPDSYWTRRRETLERHIDEVRAQLQAEGDK